MQLGPGKSKIVKTQELIQSSVPSWSRLGSLGFNPAASPLRPVQTSPEKGLPRN